VRWFAAIVPVDLRTVVDRERAAYRYLIHPARVPGCSR
jgi:hypothetical protein